MIDSKSKICLKDRVFGKEPNIMREVLLEPKHTIITSEPGKTKHRIFAYMCGKTKSNRADHWLAESYRFKPLELCIFQKLLTE